MKKYAFSILAFLFLFCSCQKIGNIPDPQVTVMPIKTGSMNSQRSPILVGMVKYPGDFEWVNQNTFKYLDETKNEDGCSYSHYQEVTLVENNENINLVLVEDYYVTQCDSSSHHYGLGNVSPNHKFLILETDAENTDNMLDLPILDEDNYKFSQQIWEYIDETNQLFSLFTIPGGYVTTWVPNEKSLIFSGSCYGVFGNGLYVVDLETKKLTTLLQDYSQCEGSYGFLISPDSRFLFVEGKAISISGKDTYQVCQKGIGPQIISKDGNSSFFICQTWKDHRFDVGTLTSFNIQNGEISNDLLNEDLTFPVVDFSISPDLKWGLFLEAESPMLMKDTNPLYLIRLNADQ